MTRLGPNRRQTLSSGATGARGGERHARESSPPSLGPSDFGSGGRNSRRRPARGQATWPAMVIQNEKWGEEESSYVPLTPGDLTGLSEVMMNLLLRMRVRERDRVLVYDFNTSLSTLVMSRFFSPGLREGACEKIKCVAICTDGLSELAARSAYVFSRWQPDSLLIRSDLLAPFRAKLPAGRLQANNPGLRSVVVVHSDAAPWPRNSRAGPGDFDRYLLYRVDPALFMCVIEPCGGMYYPDGSYEVVKEQVGLGRLRITPTFTRGHPSSPSSLECESDRRVCSCGKTHDFRTEELTI